MAISGILTLATTLVLSFFLFTYVYWRFVWFFRNPPRHPPKGENILCPADGTVVYVKHVRSFEPIIAIKKKETHRHPRYRS